MIRAFRYRMNYLAMKINFHSTLFSLPSPCPKKKCFRRPRGKSDGKQNEMETRRNFYEGKKEIFPALQAAGKKIEWLMYQQWFHTISFVLHNVHSTLSSSSHATALKFISLWIYQFHFSPFSALCLSPPSRPRQRNLKYVSMRMINSNTFSISLHLRAAHSVEAK